jgi:UDP-glucose 4-epimerase
VVYASSSSVYGDNPVLPKREDMSPNPLSPYAVTKLTGERYCQVFSRIYSLQTIILRYFNVFGPRQDPDSQYSAAIPKFIQAMMNEQPPVIYGDGEQSRDFTYVANVVQANLLAMTSDCEGGNVVNCACGRRITLNQLIAHINRILGKCIEPIYTDSKQGDIKHSLADVGQAEILLGYTPFVSFEEGLMLTIETMKTT